MNISAIPIRESLNGARNWAASTALARQTFYRRKAKYGGLEIGPADASEPEPGPCVVMEAAEEWRIPEPRRNSLIQHDVRYSHPEPDANKRDPGRDGKNGEAAEPG